MQFSSACLTVIVTLLTPYFTQGTSVNEYGRRIFFNNLESGGDYSCATMRVLQTVEENDETVLKCWGSNATGQLDVPTSQAIQSSRTGILSAGKDHACYLTAHIGGELFCWGRPDLVKIPSNLDGDIRLLAVGGNHTCVSQFDPNGSDVFEKVSCWGSSMATDDNNNNSSIIIDPPEDLGNPLRLDASISGTTTCSIAINNGTTHLVCWGCNDPADDPNSVCQNTPELIPDFTYGHVAVGLKHACIVGTNVFSSEQYITCWGDNSEGQFADVPDVQGVVGITAGDYFTCVHAWSAVKCWGENYDTVGEKYQIPEQVIEGLNVGSISAGADHVCAILRPLGVEPGVVCWGQDKDGQVSSIPSDFAFASESESSPASARFPSSIYFATVAVAFSAVTLLI